MADLADTWNVDGCTVRAYEPSERPVLVGLAPTRRGPLIKANGPAVTNRPRHVAVGDLEGSLGLVMDSVIGTELLYGDIAHSRGGAALPQDLMVLR